MTNAERLKVDSVIFECALSKLAVAFQFMKPQNLYFKNEYKNRADYFNVDSDVVVFGQTDILLFDF